MDINSWLQLNDTQNDFPEDKLIHQFFEKHASETPHRTALKFGQNQMSYGELNEKANQVAHKIGQIGVQPDQIIALAVERSFEMIIGILAILKAGCAYLPLNPKYPAARINYILNDSQVQAILTVSQYESVFDEYDTEILCLDYSSIYQDQPKDNPVAALSPSHLAYIIYTSGSTGQPKGVMIEHRSLINRLWWMQKTYQLEPTHTLLQKTTFTFDVSVWELLWWWIPGASLAILEPNKEKNPRAIVKIIEQEKINVIHFVPSMLEFFLEYISSKFDRSRLESLQYVIASGEELKLQTVRLFYKLFEGLEVSLWNLYGPTEATIDVTAYNCDLITNDNEYVPIGKPIDNTQILIVDDNGQMVPAGIKGELWITGVGVARGYVNKPELTNRHFVKDPLLSPNRIYKTGDLAAWNKKGLIEYYGRLDSQVKLRGLRIELGEIENQLLNHNTIKKCKVLLHEQSSINKYLIAFYESECPDPISDLDQYLMQFLPDYMIPSKFIKLDRFPVNDNGKTDGNKLLEWLR